MDIETLPWIELEDKQAIYQVVDFLPEAPVIIEAGCCAGEDTLKMKDLWHDSIIYCFEPNPLLFDTITTNIACPPPQFTKSKNVTNIHLSHLALADFVGEKTFYMSKFMPAASSFFEDNSINVVVPDTVLESLRIEREKYIPSYLDEPVVVQCTTIDAWRAENNIGDIDYLWLDTEGAELMILKGAVETLKKIKVISLEFNFQYFRKEMAQFDEVYACLIANGFKCHVIWRAHKNWQAVGIFIK